MVSRKRIKESLRRVDPFGKKPMLEMFFIEENIQCHLPMTYGTLMDITDLICWHIVIHRYIDGFSRMITF